MPAPNTFSNISISLRHIKSNPKLEKPPDYSENSAQSGYQDSLF